MAAIWIVFGHSAVISNMKSGQRISGIRTRDPRLPCRNADHCTTTSPTHYVDKTWNVAVVEKKRLNLMKMRYLRSVWRVMLLDRVRNQEVRRRTVVTGELAG